MKSVKSSFKINHGKILKERFEKTDVLQRQKIWESLCKFYFQKYINKNDIVIEIGAGFCEFINSITCKKKVAVDIAPELRRYANKDVEVLVAPVNKIPQKYFGNYSIVFMSNLLEHLPMKEDVVETLHISNKLLQKNGKIIILQPNIDLAKEKYWDRIDHYVPLNGESIKEALRNCGFSRIIFVKRFLPLTTKSKFPKPSWLIKLYLLFPSFLRPFAGQSLFVAFKE